MVETLLTLTRLLARPTNQESRTFFIFFFNQFWFNLFLLYCLCSMVTTGPVSRQICRCLILYTFYLLLSSIHPFVRSFIIIADHAQQSVPEQHNIRPDHTLLWSRGRELCETNQLQTKSREHTQTHTNRHIETKHSSIKSKFQRTIRFAECFLCKQESKHKTDSLDDTPTAATTTTATLTSKQ